MRDDLFGPGESALVIGHRGAAGAAPENTLPAIRHAVKVDADAVEIDVRATRDDRIVLLHDATVDRTTDGTGPVAELELDELRRLDAGHGFAPGGSGERPFRESGVTVPTLEEALEAAGSLPVVVDVKSARAGDLLDRWLKRHPDATRVLVGGFQRSAVERPAARARWRCATEDELRPYLVAGKLGLAGPFVPDSDAVMVPERRGILRIVTGRFVRRAHRDGLGVHVWTVNRPDRMRALLDLGVDGLISDAPGRARRILEERAAAGGPPARRPASS